MSYDKEFNEINNDIKEKEELILILQNQINELHEKKNQLIQNNCEHVYEVSNYCETSNNECIKTLLKCKNCGKRAYLKGLLLFETKNQ